MAAPSLGLRALQGDPKGEWSVSVSHVWRVTFLTDGSGIQDVKYKNHRTGVWRTR